MSPFAAFLLFVVLQRLGELLLARRNERWLRRCRNGVEYDSEGYKVVVLLHVGFLSSLVLEKVLAAKVLHPAWPLLAILFAAAQLLRYWAILSLGRSWNTKILVPTPPVVIRRGPYRYMNHPNYVAVAVEIAVIPLLFSCYVTAVVFSVLNALVLTRRIRIEERLLHGRPTRDG